MLDGALQLVEAECAATGRAHLWEVFAARAIRPAEGGAAPPPYEQLARQIGFDSAKQASNAFQSTRRMLKRTIRTMIGQYARDEDEIEDEIGSLFVHIAEARGDGDRLTEMLR